MDVPGVDQIAELIGPITTDNNADLTVKIDVGVQTKATNTGNLRTETEGDTLMAKIIASLNNTAIDVREGKAQGLVAVIAIVLIVLVPAFIAH